MVKNESFVSIVPLRGNLAIERVGLVIKCHLVKEKEKKNFTCRLRLGEERTEYRSTRDVQLHLAAYHHHFHTHTLRISSSFASSSLTMPSCGASSVGLGRGRTVRLFPCRP